MFCDVDTRRAASHVIQLGYVQGGFDADEIRQRLLPLLTKEDGLLYGSGFETQPWLLKEIAQYCQLFGNHPETVEITKDPGRFFSTLSRLGIPYPDISLIPPASEAGWLSKRIGGSGGTHVVPVADQGGASRYYQRQMPGQPYSLLFLADGRQVRVVGYNMQLLAPLPEMPYRYGGAASHAALPDAVRKAMLQAAERITAELGLRGLNSLDCIVHENDILVLEVNPRLSATFSLYDAAHSGARLLEEHMQASMGRLPEPLPPEQSQAHLIYYAPFDLTIPAAMHWPDWVVDVPGSAICVTAEEPFCTVTAAADSVSEALALARARVESLTKRII